MSCTRILLSVNSILKCKDLRKSRNVYVHCQFGQALFKLGEINKDKDSVAAYNSLRARNRLGSPAKSIGEK
jgi:hypothetical protein